MTLFTFSSFLLSNCGLLNFLSCVQTEKLRARPLTDPSIIERKANTGAVPAHAAPAANPLPIPVALGAIAVEALVLARTAQCCTAGRRVSGVNPGVDHRPPQKAPAVSAPLREEDAHAGARPYLLTAIDAMTGL